MSVPYQNNHRTNIAAILLSDFTALLLILFFSFKVLAQHYYLSRILLTGTVIIDLFFIGLFLLVKLNKKRKMEISQARIVFTNRLLLSLLYSYLLYSYLPMRIGSDSPLLLLILGSQLHVWLSFILLQKFRHPVLAALLFSSTFVQIILLSFLREYSYAIPGLILLFSLIIFLVNLLGTRQYESSQKERLTTERIGELKAQLLHYERTHQLQSITASFVHEVNNPLTHMEGNVFFIREQQENLEALLDSGQVGDDNAEEKIMSVIDELNDISRQYEVGFGTIQKLVTRMKRVYLVTKKEEPQLIDAVEVLNDVIMLTVPLHLRKSLHVTVPAKIEIFIQEIDLVSLFSNPLKNAIEAVSRLKDDKEIIINLQTGNTYTRHMKYTVKDNGCGFSDKKESTGMGLGLKICSNISEGNGGFMETGNREDGGAFVSIILPLNIEN